MTEQTREYKLATLVGYIIDAVYGDGYTISHTQYGQVVEIANSIMEASVAQIANVFVLDTVDTILRFCQVATSPTDCSVKVVVGHDGGTINIAVRRSE